MADDWEVGDLALCIKQGAWKALSGTFGTDSVEPRPGGIYEVTGVIVAGTSRTLFWPAGAVGLELAGFSDCYNAERFRKVTPPKADEFDTEVIELLNRKPVEA